MKKIVKKKFDKIPLKNDPLYKEGYAHTLPKSDKKRIARYAKERKKYGFDSTINWSLDGEIAKFLVPRLIMYNLYDHCGIPIYALSEEEQQEYNQFLDLSFWTSKTKKEKTPFKKRQKELQKKSYIEWDKIMNEMIEGFYSIVDYDYLPSEERSEKQRRAMDLLSKYFFTLWD